MMNKKKKITDRVLRTRRNFKKIAQKKLHFSFLSYFIKKWDSK